MDPTRATVAHADTGFMPNSSVQQCSPLSLWQLHHVVCIPQLTRVMRHHSVQAANVPFLIARSSAMVNVLVTICCECSQRELKVNYYSWVSAPVHAGRAQSFADIDKQRLIQQP